MPLMRICALFSIGPAGCSNLYEGDLGDRAEQSSQQLSAWSASQEQAEQVSALTDMLPISEVEELIAAALQNNTGVQQQLLSLKLARAQKKSVSSARLPQASAGVAGIKSENSNSSYSSSVHVSH